MSDFTQMADDLAAAARDAAALAVQPAPAPEPEVRVPDVVDGNLAALIRRALHQPNDAVDPAAPVVLVLTQDQAVDLAVLAEFATYARDTLDPLVAQMAPLLESLGSGMAGRLLGIGKG